MVEAFAVCREGGRRFLNMRHYDVQLIGGIVLHNGMIAEMVTGEGKTLVATLRMGVPETMDGWKTAPEPAVGGAGGAA